MPIPFSYIPEEVQILIIEKLLFSDLPKFTECCRESKGLSLKLKRRICIPGNVYAEKLENTLMFKWFGIHYGCVKDENLLKVPVRFEPLTHEFCMRVVEALRTTNSSFSVLDIQTLYNITSDSLNLLFEISNVKHFRCKYAISRDFFNAPAMPKLNSLTVYSPLDDADLILLNNPTMNLEKTNISNYGINMILREWLAGTRTMSFIRISSYHVLEENILFNGFHDTLTQLPESSYIIRDKNKRKLHVTVGVHSIEIRIYEL